jgi:5'-nucleotidase
MKNILLSNDDGIESKGIWVLRENLTSYYRVYVVAPDRERSATGHSISLHDPIRVKEIEKDKVFAADGTPVDAVHIALLGMVNVPIDVVVTGINNGLNLGSDVFYSGTVSAAFQAAAFHLPGIAVSLDTHGPTVHYETAAFFTRKILKKIENHTLNSDVVLNVNVPNVSIDDIQGIEITRLGRRSYEDRLIEREDPKKNKYYWIEGKHTRDELDDGTDVKAIHEKKVSITPLYLDITAHEYIDKLRDLTFHEIDKERE